MNTNKYINSNARINATYYQEEVESIRHNYVKNYIDFIYNGGLLSRMIALPVNDPVIQADFIHRHKMYLHKIYRI